MRNDLGNGKFIFNPEQNPNRPNRQFNPNQRRPRGQVGGGMQPRRVEPKKKFIDDNLFLDPNLNKPPKSPIKITKNFIVYILIGVIVVLVLVGIFMLIKNIIKNKKPNEPGVIVNKNIFVGSWNCKDYITTDGKNYTVGDKYIISLSFDNDNKFKFGSYNDLENNYSVGNYKFNFVQAKTDDIHIYNLLLSSTKAIKDGKLNVGKYSSEYLVEISKTNGNMILGNKTNKSVYICTSNDRTNPKIEG